jgi:hypothetical protein
MSEYRELLNLYFGPVLDNLLEEGLNCEILAEEVFGGAVVEKESVEFQKCDDGSWDINCSTKVLKNHRWDGLIEDALYLQEKGYSR